MKINNLINLKKHLMKKNYINKYNFNKEIKLELE